MADTERGFTFSEDKFSTALAEALRYFKYDSLKVEQIECLRRVICLREDVLAVLPTGFGKSLIYQIIPKVLKCLEMKATTLKSSSSALSVSLLNEFLIFLFLRKDEETRQCNLGAFCWMSLINSSFRKSARFSKSPLYL